RSAHRTPAPAPPPAAFYTLPLPGALPISGAGSAHTAVALDAGSIAGDGVQGIGSGAASAPAQLTVLHQDALALRRDGENVPPRVDRKSTRLNSSHVSISYAVFCLTKHRHP